MVEVENTDRHNNRDRLLNIEFRALRVLLLSKLKKKKTIFKYLKKIFY